MATHLVHGGRLTRPGIAAGLLSMNGEQKTASDEAKRGVDCGGGGGAGVALTRRLVAITLLIC